MAFLPQVVEQDVQNDSEMQVRMSLASERLSTVVLAISRNPCRGLFRMPVFIIIDKMAKRIVVKALKYVAQLGCLRLARRERVAVNLAQAVHGGVAVFLADLAILVAVAIVHSWLFHERAPDWVWGN